MNKNHQRTIASNLMFSTARITVLGLLLAFSFTLTACGEAQAAPRNPDDVLGEWEIAEEDPQAGQIKTDRENPDPALRDTLLLGIDLIHGFRWDSQQYRWVEGKIYNPFDGKTYNCQIEMETETKIKIRGYIGLPILGQTVYWERPKSEPATRGGFYATPK